jgi:hypothetical protein
MPNTKPNNKKNVPVFVSPLPHQDNQHQILRHLEHSLVQKVELVKDVHIRKKLVGFAAKYIKYSR